jgi:hypothetical protein
VSTTGTYVTSVQGCEFEILPLNPVQKGIVCSLWSGCSIGNLTISLDKSLSNTQIESDKISLVAEQDTMAL